VFFFIATAHNDRGYGLGRAAGEFPVAIATKEMRAQNPLSARQPACEHRRVLAAVFFIHFQQVDIPQVRLTKYFLCLV
jgi:hypothetical protein